jgi:hypothetical protein
MYFTIITVLLSHYNEPLRRSQSTLTIALHRGVHLAIIIDRYGGPQSVLTITFHRDLYFTVIMDRYEGP